MTTIILNHAPYGTEKSYNGLRIALSLKKKKRNVRIYMIDDGVLNAIKGQKTPDGYYNIERLIKSLVKRNSDVYIWGSCSDTRGVSDDIIIDGVKRGNLDILAEWIISSDNVLTY